MFYNQCVLMIFYSISKDQVTYWIFFLSLFLQKRGGLARTSQVWNNLFEAMFNFFTLALHSFLQVDTRFQGRSCPCWQKRDFIFFLELFFKYSSFSSSQFFVGDIQQYGKEQNIQQGFFFQFCSYVHLIILVVTELLSIYLVFVYLVVCTHCCFVLY
eukprot:TRINITY_DN12051_c1_g1_i1.p2 TRINITY_DN12051_c1_g1~~TRINITY_DN12051_c1_g1_i1.p2  ORF type:complete len:157 (+),score=3.54 TRINITY_DN12051_c1_g1_i1:661-1131(+)